jgi:hypothetical protein
MWQYLIVSDLVEVLKREKNLHVLSLRDRGIASPAWSFGESLDVRQLTGASPFGGSNKSRAYRLLVTRTMP